MLGLVHHYRARALDLIHDPGSLLMVLLGAGITTVVWPGLTSQVYPGGWVLPWAGQEMRATLEWVFVLLWFVIWPLLIVLSISGRPAAGRGTSVLGGVILPALPVGPTARITAEILLALSFVTGARAAVLPWINGPDRAAYALGTLWGAVVMIPPLVAAMIPSRGSGTMKLWTVVAALWVVIAGRLRLLESPWTLVPTCAALTALFLSARTWRLPALALLRGRAAPPESRYRPALPPERRLLLDFWTEFFLRYGSLVAAAFVLPLGALVWDALFGLPKYLFWIVSVALLAGLGVQFLLRPLGSVLLAASFLSSKGFQSGDFARAWGFLPIRREIFYQGIYLHGLLTTGILWCWGIALASFRSWMDAGASGLWADAVLQRMAFGTVAFVPALAGMLTSGVAGRQKHFLGSAFLLMIGVHVHLLLAIQWPLWDTVFLLATVLVCAVPPLVHLRPSPRNSQRSPLMHRIASVPVLLLAALAVATLPSPAAGAPLTPEQTDKNLESFDHVWSTIDRTFWDPDYLGLDWKAIGEECRPKVERAATDWEARAVMDEMLERFGKTHFAIVPGAAYEKLGGMPGQGILDGWLGLEARVLDGRAIVTVVHEGSPGEAAGIRPGWEVTRVGKKYLRPGIRKLQEEFRGKLYEEAIPSIVVRERLAGRVGEKIALGFRDGRGRRKSLTLACAERKGFKYTLGNLPAMYVWIESRRLPGDIGYVRFSNFLDPPHLMPAWNEAMRSFLDARGLIVDLRGNGGGLGDMVVGMVGWLIPEKNRYLGTLTTREVALKLVVNPRIQTFEGPVAVLVDPLSASASEFFSGGLQDLGRACVVGERTAGAALPSVFERLPNGDGFQYVTGNYVSADGEPLEGAGVTPDIPVRPTREALLEGRDLPLEAALDWIRTRTNQTGPGARSH